MLEIKDRDELKRIVFEIIREHILEKVREKTLRSLIWAKPLVEPS